MKFDDFLSVLGDFGPYQRKTYLLLCIPLMLTGMQLMSTLFILYVPPHRCKIPGMPNDTYQIQSVTHQRLVDLYIPQEKLDTGEFALSECTYNRYTKKNISELLEDRINATESTPGVNMTMINTNVSTFEELRQSLLNYMTNVTMADRLAANESGIMATECREWVYDTTVRKTSVTIEENIICDRQIYRAHASTVIALGGLVGFVVIGTISDKYGRKVAYMVELIVITVSSIATIWVPNIYVFIVFRFLTGLGFGGLYNGAFVYAMEFIGPSWRTVLGIVINNFWGVGLMIQTLLAWLLPNWTYLQLAMSLPHIPFLIYFWVIPESPRWLLASGRTKRGMAIVRDMARANKVDIKDVEQIKLDADIDEESGGSFLDLFKTKSLCITTLIVFLNWLIVAMTYYGLTLNVSNLGGDLYLNFLYTAIIEVCAYTLSIPCLYCTGRKTLHCACMLLSGISLLLVIIPKVIPSLETDSSVDIALILSLVGKFGSSAAFATIYLFSVELFPTVVRNTAMGYSAACSGVGGVIAPYVVEMGTLLRGHVGNIVPLVIFGVASIVAGLLALFLPETRNKKMPEKIGDM